MARSTPSSVTSRSAVPSPSVSNSSTLEVSLKRASALLSPPVNELVWSPRKAKPTPALAVKLSRKMSSASSVASKSAMTSRADRTESVAAVKRKMSEPPLPVRVSAPVPSALQTS